MFVKSRLRGSGKEVQIAVKSARYRRFNVDYNRLEAGGGNVNTDCKKHDNCVKTYGRAPCDCPLYDGGGSSPIHNVVTNGGSGESAEGAENADLKRYTFFEDNQNSLPQFDILAKTPMQAFKVAYDMYGPQVDDLFCN